MKGRSISVIVVMTGALGLVACGPGPGSPNGSGVQAVALDVVATTTQVGSLAAEIGGEDVNLNVLLGPGVEAHDFELSPEQGAALERADLVLISGAGLEDWLADTIESVGIADRVRDLSEGIELRAPSAGEAAHGQGDEAGHADDEVDPHYWLSAPNAIRMAENVRDALSEAAPRVADRFERRAAEVIARLQDADAEVRRLIGEVPERDRKVVTDHDALGYFLAEYGLEFVGAVFPSLDVASEPSARDVETLVSEIRERGVRAIFTESAVNPALAEAVAAETDARLVDEPLYTDSLGPPGSGADTLDGMLLHNARVIRDGLLAEESEG